MNTTNLIDPMVAGDDVRAMGRGEGAGRGRDDAIRDRAILTGDLKGLMGRMRRGDASVAAKAERLSRRRAELVERYNLHAVAAAFAARA